MTVALEATGLVKRYPGVTALDGVDLTLRSGEVMALLGANGSGKSTLIKILAGVVPADAGTVRLAGRDPVPAADLTPALAAAEGLHFVHQHSALFGTLSVAENLALGRGYDRGRLGRVRWRAIRERAATDLARFAIDADPDTPVHRLSPVDRKLLDIARALPARDGAGGGERRGVLVLDEPSAALPEGEVERLIERIRTEAREGQAILFVSHRLPEVLGLADRIGVLRDGRNVATVAPAEVDEGRLVELMVGRAVRAQERAAPVAATGGAVLELEGLSVGPLRGIDLRVAPGEVVGVAGLDGAGQHELLEAVFGARTADAGSVRIDGASPRPGSVPAAMAAGVAYVPADRAAHAAFGGHDLQQNVFVADRARYFRRGRNRHRAERAEAAEVLGRMRVKAASTAVPLHTLSGGNQQKVVFGRWIRRRPRVLLLHEPTQGVDVAARAELYALIREQAEQSGLATLVASSDFDELALLCDRVLVLARGAIAAEVPGDQLDGDLLNHLVHDPIPEPR